MSDVRLATTAQSGARRELTRTTSLGGNRIWGFAISDEDAERPLSRTSGDPGCPQLTPCAPLIVADSGTAGTTSPNHQPSERRARHGETATEGDRSGAQAAIGTLAGPHRQRRRPARLARLVRDLGLGHLHSHDLRHTGNTLAAATRASTKELMSRMGHSSSRAALIYQHATAERELALAQRLSGMVLATRR
jgi:hypothetical protein